MSKKIILVEADQAFIGRLKRILLKIGIKNEYEILSPSFSNLSYEDDSNLIQSCLNESVNLINKNIDNVVGILVDIRIVEDTSDTTGINIALLLKEKYPLIPVINITNHYSGSNIDLFGEVSLGDIDGVLPKSYFISENFTRKRLINIFEVTQKKILKRQNIVSDQSFSMLHNVKADIAVITALMEPEFDAFSNIFPLKPIAKKDLKFDDTSTYFLHECEIDGKVLKIVAATDDKMGMPATTSLSTRIIQQFNPKFIVMLGICAGVEGTPEIGDVLIASYCFDYGSGKNHIVENKNHRPIEVFQPYHDPYRLDEEIRKAIINLVGKDKLMAGIKKKSKDFPENTHNLSYFVGPFASGAAVIANKKLVAKIKSQEGKLIGFDMESYGVFYASKNSNDKTQAITIKAVSDFGTEQKNTPLKKTHQLYASTNSVLFFKTILEKVLIKHL